MVECYFQQNCRLKPTTLLKVTLERGCFSRFLKYVNGTKLCKAFRVIDLADFRAGGTYDPPLPALQKRQPKSPRRIVLKTAWIRKNQTVVKKIKSELVCKRI